MANALQTAAHLVTINDRNLADIDVDDLLRGAPVLASMFAQGASNGTDHKYLKRSGAGSAGFRAANAGRDHDKSDDTLVTIALAILDASFGVDQALATEYKMGRAAYVDREAQTHLRQAFFELEQQILNGTSNDSGGFNGLADSADLDALADTETVIDAGGTTASTATSVYLIRSAENACSVVFGNEGEITIGETAEVPLTDGSSKTFPGLWTPITGWAGLQLGSKYDVVRIVNITADSGKGFTDDLVATALNAFKTGFGPTFMAISKRSNLQLQASRTATHPTGNPAPFATESHGIPIIVTDAISDTEELIA